MIPLSKDIAYHLVSSRVRAGLTQQQVSELTGIPAGMLADIENRHMARVNEKVIEHLYEFFANVASGNVQPHPISEADMYPTSDVNPELMSWVNLRTATGFDVIGEDSLNDDHKQLWQLMTIKQKRKALRMIHALLYEERSEENGN